MNGDMRRQRRCKTENSAWRAGYDKWNDEVVVQTE